LRISQLNPTQNAPSTSLVSPYSTDSYACPY
jgi:hypothetical protein